MSVTAVGRIKKTVTTRATVYQLSNLLPRSTKLRSSSRNWTNLTCQKRNLRQTSNLQSQLASTSSTRTSKRPTSLSSKCPSKRAQMPPYRKMHCRSLLSTMCQTSSSQRSASTPAPNALSPRTPTCLHQPRTPQSQANG